MRQYFLRVITPSFCLALAGSFLLDLANRTVLHGVDPHQDGILELVLFVALFLAGWIFVSLFLARSAAAAMAEGAYVTGMGNFAKLCTVLCTGIVVGVAFIIISRTVTESVFGSLLNLPHNELGRLLEIEDFSLGVALALMMRLHGSGSTSMAEASKDA